MAFIVPNTTVLEFRADRLAQVKKMIQANPGINVLVLDGLSLAGIAAGVELRVRYDEPTNTLVVRCE